jgi:hypothetical protein
LREKTYLDSLWDSGKAPWKLWGGDQKGPMELATQGLAKSGW